MSGVIFKFAPEMVNMFLKTRFPAKIDGKHIMFRWVEGDDEMDEKKQSSSATQRLFRVTSQEMLIEDESAINFLKHHPRFGTMITIRDPEAENKAKIEQLHSEMELVMRVSRLSDQEVLQLGIMKLGSREALDMVKNGDYNGLRIEMAAFASTHQEEVKKLLDEKQNGNFLFAALAFAAQIVKEDESGTVVKWADNGARITSVTKGMKPVEELANYFETVEGNEVKQEIGIRMEKKSAKRTAAKNPAKEAEKTEAEK